MIRRDEIAQRVFEWGLRDAVIEKDYVLGWLLWGIGQDRELGNSWVFKGGTCLKKCYVETYRFSEDLDFTVLPGGPVLPDEVLPHLRRILPRITEESGIDFSVAEPRVRIRPEGNSSEGSVYYRGPLGLPGPPRIRLDLSSAETVVRPPVLRLIRHSYPDSLPPPGEIRCYDFDELFAEKIRALGERVRPRDLYDVINLYWRDDLRAHPALIKRALREKCEAKGVPIPTHAAIESSPHRQELESEWANMLGHQLPQLPPFALFWETLPHVFEWLEAEVAPAALPAMPNVGVSAANVDEHWTPPPGAWVWGAGGPFEAVRFAAANHLAIDLGYGGRHRLIEPYSLRRTMDGNLLLHALHAGTDEHRSYRVDRITSVAVTRHPFSPRYAIELSATGPLHAPETIRRPRRTTRVTGTRTATSSRVKRTRRLRRRR